MTTNEIYVPKLGDVIIPGTHPKKGTSCSQTCLSLQG